MIYISMRKEFRHTPLSDGQVVLWVSGGNALVDGGNNESLLFLHLQGLHDTGCLKRFTATSFQLELSWSVWR